jgi:hypothetical protein
MTFWDRGVFWRAPLYRNENLLKLLVVLVILLLLAVGIFSAIWNLSTVLGEIIVSSPQIYTRERLVNDRYDQAHWLQKQLQLLDDTTELSSGVISQSNELSVSGRLGPIGQESTSASLVGANRELPKLDSNEESLPFDLKFVIRGSIRDTIRELALENSLDDRHDLRGELNLRFEI